MKHYISYIGGFLVLSLFPVFVTCVWSDNMVWRKILLTQFVIVALLILVSKTTKAAKEGDEA